MELYFSYDVVSLRTQKYLALRHVLARIRNRPHQNVLSLSPFIIDTDEYIAYQTRGRATRMIQTDSSPPPPKVTPMAHIIGEVIKGNFLRFLEPGLLINQSRAPKGLLRAMERCSSAG